MISAEVIKGVHQLLETRGVQQQPSEKFGDFVARGLGISGRQAEILLEALHEGSDVEDAAHAADIDAKAVPEELLVQVARVIGEVLGSAARKPRGNGLSG